jgi:hypothetical protein
MLKQYLFKGERVETVDNLKYMLEVEKEYERYNDFKRFVILKVQKELEEKTDICFDFEEQKTGRAITHIRFIIKQIKLNSEQDKDLQPENPLVKKLMDLGFNEKQANEIVKRETSDFIIDNAKILESYLKEGKIKSNVPAFSVGFTKDFRINKTVYEEELEIKKEQMKLESQRVKKIKSDGAKALELGQKVYYEAIKIYMTNFFKNREQNADLINEFEKKYIKSNIGSTLYKGNPEIAKQTFLASKIDKSKLNADVIKIAEASGYLLSENDGTWNAVKDTQEKLF